IDEDYIWTVHKDWIDSRNEHVKSAEWAAANSARCEFLDESCAVSEPVIMEDQVCQIGHTIVRSSELCKIARRVTIDEDYKYAATRTWSAATQDHEPDAAWSALAASAGCQKIAESCQVATEPSYEIYSCEDGYRIHTKPVSCFNRRRIEVDTDYLYKGYRNWNASASTHIPDATTFAAEGANCLKGAERCAVPSPGVFSEEICEVGYRIDYTDEAVVRNRIVTTDDDYVYEGKETWSPAQNRYNPDAARTTLIAQNPNCVQTSRTCTKVGPGVFSEYVCDAGYRDRYTKSACEVPRAVTVDRDYRYQADRVFQYGPDRWNDTSQLSALKGASSCKKNGEVCVTSSPGVFETLTCDIGIRTDYTERLGSRNRVVVVDEDYIYDAPRTWNGSYHQGNSAWQSLQADSSCELQSSVCSVATPPPFTPYACQSGYKDNESQPTCSRERTITVDPDYIYTVNRSWNTSTNRWTGTSDWNAPRSAGGNCARIEATCAKTSPGVYTTHTCEQGYSIDPENMSCRDELSFTVETDYQYYGYETWNGSSFVRDSTLNAIWTTTNNCSRTSVVNEQPWADLRSEYSCVAGSITFSDEKTCNTTLSVNVTATTKKKYSATTGSPAQTYVHGRNGCVRKSTAGGRSSYECSSTQAYHGILSNSSKTISGYEYRIVEGTGSEGQFFGNGRCKFDRAEIKPSSDGGWGWGSPIISIDDDFYFYYHCANSMSVLGATYMGRRNMQVYDHRAYLSSPGRSLLDTKLDCHHSSTSGSQGNFYCMAQYSLESLRSDGNQTYYSESDSWNTSACNAYSSSAYKGQVCNAGAATKTINGKSVYRSCWGYRRTYGTTSSRNVNSCSPPSGFSLQSSAAYNPSIGVSRSLQKRTYIKNHSRSDAASVVGNYDCFSGYWLDSNGTARWQSCSAPAGAIYVSNSCAFVDSGGTCRLRHYTYRVPAKAPTGGYSRRKETWVCNNRVYGSGVRSPSEVKKWKGWVWDRSQCNAKRASYPNGCTQTSASYVDSARTKTIDGLSLTRQYTYQRNYTCQGKNVKNTCSGYAALQPTKPIQYASLDRSRATPSPFSTIGQRGSSDYGRDETAPIRPDYPRAAPVRTPPGLGKIPAEDLRFNLPNAPVRMAAVGDYEYVGQTCVNYEGSTCTLWRKTYRREEHDPSGGCHIEQEKWRCENAISGAGTAAIVRDIVSETFPMAACNAMVAQQTSCTLIRQYQDTSTGGTRVINGLSVTRSFWSYKREYDCTKRVATETCSPPQGAVIHDVECLWKDSSNVCRLVKRNYRIPLPDPSGGCTTYTDTYRCENRNHGTPKSTTHDIVSETFPTPAVYPSRTPGCTRKSYSYSPTETRTINGLSVSRKWKLNEVFECSTQTAVDTCNPLPSGSTQQGPSTCVSANRDGTCGVSRKTYRYPVHDASGGCLRVREEYTCPDEV
ncbi:MAG: conjugal transfer protein TraN, partial [Nonlabens sp.]